MIRQAFVAALLICGAATAASGQRGAQRGGAQRGGGMGANRAGLEMQVRQKLARRARIELGLAPDQMTKLGDVDRRFGQQQRAVDQQENETRRLLRQALIESPSADQDKRVGDLHEQLMQAQRQRLDLIAAEQKELSGFMTNVQRVRFHGLQENLRRQVQDALGPPPADGPAAADRPARPPR